MSTPLAILLLGACFDWQSDRGGSVCEGTLHVDLSTSEAHCGKCGNACPKGGECRDGDCVCGAGEISCAGACVKAKDDVNCGRCGNACDAPRTCSAGECLLPLKTCNGEFVDLNTSRGNCGACGHACALAAQCYSGSCVCYANLLSDVFNCGTCGNACPATQQCIFGECR